VDVLKRIYKAKFIDVPEKDVQAITYLKNKGISDEETKKKISEALNTEYLNVSREPIDNSLLRNFSKDEMKSRRIFPIYQTTDTVYFVVNSLVDGTLKSHASEYAKYFDKTKVSLNKFLLNFEFDELLESLYRGIDINEYRDTVSINPNNTVDFSDEKRTFTQGFDAENIAEIILNKGFENRASDIHIEALDRGFQVRYRVDGILSITDPYDTSDQQSQSLINHFKLKSGLKIEERRKGQDGSIKDRKYKGNRYDIRVSVISAVSGEKLALRILEKTSSIPNFKELGFSKFYINAIKKDIDKHHGLILNTGSVGSGKSTTQRTILVDTDAKKLNIYSIEDPVERSIPYVNHVCVKETGVSFEDHLETLLRQDPDIVAIGEIRNLQTMDMALKAALTGQLVFATMHTNSALEAFYRLFNMGVESYELGAAILGISSQRLVRTLCPYCSIKRDTTDVERKLILGLLSKYERFSEFNMSKFDYIHDAVGCNHCNHTGYFGRTVVGEYLSANDEMRSYISSGEVDRDKLLELADNTFVPIEVDALNKVLLGKTTISEVIKVV
jgi:type II secretory ATPase GspE/PulE/Tfp pilus assembly ATPase PilB-like protein